jgi:hypothetical protein
MLGAAGVLLFVLAVENSRSDENCVVRDLGRMRVTELPLGLYVDTKIIGETFGADFYGRSVICGNPIRTIEYSANLITFLGDEVIRHELYDFADAIAFEGNGAQYRVRSRLPGVGEYNIIFFRRAPENAGYDPATLFRITVFTEEVVVVEPFDGDPPDDGTELGPGPGPIEEEPEIEPEIIRKAFIYELDYRNP